MSRRKRPPRRPPLLALVHGFNAQRFADRVGLTPFSHPCDTCRRTRTTSVPFVEGAMRGLMAPPCVCGDAGRMYCVPLEAFCR